MCVCVCVCIDVLYLCMHACIHTRARTNTHARTHAHVCTRTRAREHTHSQIRGAFTTRGGDTLSRPRTLPTCGTAASSPSSEILPSPSTSTVLASSSTSALLGLRRYRTRRGPAGCSSSAEVSKTCSDGSRGNEASSWSYQISYALYIGQNRYHGSWKLGFYILGACFKITNPLKINQNPSKSIKIH